MFGNDIGICSRLTLASVMGGLAGVATAGSLSVAAWLYIGLTTPSGQCPASLVPLFISAGIGTAAATAGFFGTLVSLTAPESRESQAPIPARPSFRPISANS